MLNAGAIATFVAILLIGGRPSAGPVENLRLEPTATWASRPRESGPTVTRPVPDRGTGWRVAFRAGSKNDVGYVDTPIPGDRLRALGVNAVHVELRGNGTPGVALMFTSSQGTYRRELTFDPADDSLEITIPFATMSPDRPGMSSGETASVRAVRIGAPSTGFERPTTIDVLEVRFIATASPAPAVEPSRARLGLPGATTGVVAREGRLFSDGEPFFPFGVYSLGGNRRRLEQIATAGANSVVEYGPAMWPLVTVEDHLDYARCAGVRLGLALTAEKHGRAEISDTRLAPLAGHRDLLAWYLFDEPNAGTRRGVADCSPERLRARRDALDQPPPVLVTCTNPFVLERYAETADILSTDHYLPAWGPDRPLAVLHSDAEAVAEIAARHDAVPVVVLQLAGPRWTDPSKLQSKSSLEAQVFAALAAGMRGILLYEGVTPQRWAREGRDEGKIWDAFLELSGRVSTWGPLAARWTRVPGEPQLTPVLGDVRASCFREGETAWIVMVNLGDRAQNVHLGGECLSGALRLEDPTDGWSTTVENGGWSGRLGRREGRVVRIVRAESGSAPGAVVENLTPPSTDGANLLRYDRTVLGASLYPAPAGAIRVHLDGEERTSAAIVHRGPAAVVRTPIAGLAPGAHRAELSWMEASAPRRFSWEFRVDPVELPVTDRFDRSVLGESWGIVRDVRWIHFDPEETLAGGTVTIVDGELRIASTRGSLGVVLRRVDAPEAFTMRFSVRVASSATILVRRNEPFRRLPISAGSHEILWRETPGTQSVTVDGRPAGEWSPPFDHQGGEIALGVAAGEEAFFDDFRLDAR